MYLLREIKVVVSGIKSIHSLLVWLISGTVYLINVVVFASSLDTVKNRFWGNQDVKYDYTAELTGAGSRSEIYMK